MSEEVEKRIYIPFRKRDLCVNGHFMIPKNTYFTPKGQMMCRECKRERANRDRAKLRKIREAAIEKYG